MFEIDKIVEGPLVKHRDGLHDTFAEHEFDNGATLLVGSSYMCVANPITEEDFDSPQKYYLVKVTLHTGKEYDYLVPEAEFGGRPTTLDVMEAMDQYNKNPVFGGRDWRMYVEADEESVKSIIEGLVNARS